MSESTRSAMSATLAVRLRFLNERINPQSKDWSPAKLDAAMKDLGVIEKDLERVLEGKSILPAGRALLMGYHSDLDDGDQPYSLWIPPEYDGTKAFPLVVMLHGQGMFNPLQCNAGPVGKNIVVAPQGRGGMDYMYVGEGDILRVIGEVQNLLKIDPNRVCLAGSSMGGSGSWHLATRYPDRFAGIMPLCGNTDINVWQDRWFWRTPKDSPIAAVRHFMREDTCAITYAGNLRNVGIVALQGDADPIVKPEHGLHMFDVLKSMGHENFKTFMLPLVMHGFSCDYAQGLKPFVRDPHPRHVFYKTAWLKYPGAYWLRIAGIGERLKHATVDGVADPATSSIEIKTSNVSRLKIERSALPFDGAPKRISIDGVAVPAESVEFEKSGNDWRAARAETEESFPPRKTAGLEGPVEHAFMSRFLIVTEKGPGGAKDNAQAFGPEQAARNCVDEWKTRFAVPCRHKSAGAMSDQDIADSNLILFGTPEENSITRIVAQKLPLNFAADGIEFSSKKYQGANLGIIMCYPNPLNPKRYVVLVAGTTPRSYADINVRFGNWFDWIPYDARRHYDFAIFDDMTSGRSPETFLLWGFFGEDWKVAPQFEFAAVPSWREKLLPRILPSRDLSAWDSAEPLPDVLYLDEVIPRQVSVNKEYIERNRTLDGSVLQIKGQDFRRGLCARFPCSLTFDCGGYSTLKVTPGVAWDGVSEVSDDRKESEKVTVTISIDGKQAFEAQNQTYRSRPKEVSIDLKGAKTVTFSANGGLTWLNGSFIWADARLEKEPPAKEKR